jgi:hypothetical protein
MLPSEIEESVLQALDDGHEPTLEQYSEFAAGHIDAGALTEALFLSIIETDREQWTAVLAACLRTGAPELGEALAKIERHIDAQRKPFAAARASGLDDASEHDRHLLADLQRELNSGGY